MNTTYRADVFLEHYGVKGMKWGVRKASGTPSRTRQGYANRQNRKADRKDRRTEKRRQRTANYQETLDRIATGKKTSGDLLLMLNTTNIWDVATAVSNRESVGKAYARNSQGIIDRATRQQAKRDVKSQKMRDHAERVVAGEGTTKDMLKYYGTVNIRDTIRG